MRYLAFGSKRFSGFLPLFAILFLNFFAINTWAQAPASLAGKTLFITVTSGSGEGMAKSGKLSLVFDNSGDGFHIYGITTNLSDEAGTYTYTQNSATQGTFVLTEGTNQLSVIMKFTSSAGGTYRLTVVGGSGVQSGTFQIFGGAAPANLSDRVLDLTVTSGASPFTATGHFRMFLHGDGTYSLKNVVNNQTSTGTYGQEVSTASMLLLTFNDSGVGSGFSVFAFSNSVGGAYFFANETGFQTGKFHEVLPPTITQSPTSTSIILNKPISLTVKVTGEGPLKYQWFFEGNPIAKATNSILPIASIKGTNAGSYYVVVTNDGGAATTSTFTIDVLFPPAVVTQPVGQTNPVGSTIALSVVATGTEPLRYQWQFNGINLAGKTNSSLSITNAKLSNSGSYRVLIKNVAGTTSSKLVRVKILTPVQITGFPRAYLANTNAKVLLAVTATGSAPLHYQWQLNGVNIPGATKPQYIINGLTDTNAGSYTIVITNSVSLTNYSTVVYVTSSRFDPNKDGQTDLLIKSTDGKLITWFLSGTSFLKNVTLNRGKPIDTALDTAGIGDFDHDGNKDLFLQNTNTGSVMVWRMNGTNFVGTNVLNTAGIVTPDWKVVTLGDFDHNGDLDLVAQNRTNGVVAVFLMQGTNSIYNQPVILITLDERYAIFTPVCTPWKLSGIGNFHGNVLESGVDLIGQNEVGELAAWLMNKTNFTVQVLETNGELIVLNSELYFVTNYTTIELAPGTLYSTDCKLGFGVFNAYVGTNDLPQRVSPGPEWKAASIADFNFDGFQDIVFQKDDGRLIIWYPYGVFVVGAEALRGGQPINRSWRVAGPK